MNECINDKAVFRTVPATQGLSNIQTKKTLKIERQPGTGQSPHPSAGPYILAFFIVDVKMKTKG